jgi:transposase
MAVDDVATGRAEGLTSSEKAELAELRRRNRVLEMEVEVLKRAERLLRAGEHPPR